MRKILCITLLILAAALSVSAQKPLTHKSRAQKSRARKPLVQKPLAANRVVEKPPVEMPLVETPPVENPLVETPLVENPFVRNPFVQNPRAQSPLVQDNEDPLVSERQPLGTIMPAVDESPGTQFSPDFEGYIDLTGLATYADAQAHSHTNLVTIDVVYSYRSYVMPGNGGDAFLGNVINVQGPNGGLRLWMPFSANAGYWVGFICNIEGYARYRNLRMTYDADNGIVTALDYR